MKRFLLGSLLLTLLSAGPGEVRASRPNPGKEDSPTGYEIRVKLHNYPDSLNHFLRLGRYYWSGRYLVDTAVYHPENETYVFSGPESMEGGMYLLITGDDRYAEFVFDQNQHIGIETTYPQLFSSIRFEDSPENDLFVNFSKNGQADFEKVDELRKQLDAAKQAQDEAKAGKIQQEISALYDKMDQDRADFIQEHPGHLMSAIFKAQQDVHVPEAPASVPDSLKRQWTYEYYKNHFFDNYDLCDERMLHTPVLFQRVSAFQDKVLHMQNPDTIKYAWERLIEKTRCNPEMFKAFIAHPVDHYQRSLIIGQDAIWVYLAKKYYLGGDAWWASASLVENFRKRIERVEPLLIGNRPLDFSCPDTNVDTPEEMWVSVFSSPKRYTVVLFWSLSCVHCQTSVPKWHELYRKHGEDWDFDVIAICKDHDVAEWKQYIHKHGLQDWTNLCGKKATLDYDDKWDVTTTPTIYVLDEQKRIVTKMIEPEYLEEFLKSWEKSHPKP